MNIARTTWFAVLVGCSTVTFAHTHLVKSVPAEGSTVAISPPSFVLTFTEPATLTALSLQKAGEPARKLGPLPRAAAAEISVPAPPLTAGKYMLSWRVLSKDGHVMPGKVRFTVGPSGA